MFYVAWWIVGLMPAVYEFLARCLHGDDERPPLSPVLLIFMVLRGPVAGGAALAFCITCTMYTVPFYGAMAAPPLLALAMLFNRSVPTQLHIPRKDIAALLRIFVAHRRDRGIRHQPGTLTLFWDPHGHLTMTTLRLASIGAFLEFVYAFVRERWVFALIAGLFALFADAYGPSAQQVNNSSASSVRIP